MQPLPQQCFQPKFAELAGTRKSKRDNDTDSVASNDSATVAALKAKKARAAAAAAQAAATAAPAELEEQEALER